MRQFALLSGGKCQTSSWFTTRKTFYDTPRLLHIEQQKNDNNTDFCRRNLTLMAIASTELTIKVAKRRREVVGGGSETGGAAGWITQRGAWTWRPYLLRINTTLREFRASEQVQLRAGERRRMCCTSDLGDSEGARRRKTSSLHFHACIYYSPKARQWGQRRNEQASSSTRKVIGWSPGVNVSFIILTPDPWPQTFRGHGFHFKQFASLRRARPAQLFML